MFAGPKVRIDGTLHFLNMDYDEKLADPESELFMAYSEDVCKKVSCEKYGCGLYGCVCGGGSMNIRGCGSNNCNSIIRHSLFVIRYSLFR